MRINFRKQIIVILFILWVATSVLFTLFNSLKFTSEFRLWYPLSDYQKRHEIFGNVYDFLIFIGNNTKYNSKITIYSSDPRIFYLGVYYLYPRYIYTTNNINEVKSISKANNFDYLATFNKNYKPDKSTKTLKVNLEGSKEFGELFKIR